MPGLAAEDDDHDDDEEEDTPPVQQKQAKKRSAQGKKTASEDIGHQVEPLAPVAVPGYSGKRQAKVGTKRGRAGEPRRHAKGPPTAEGATAESKETALHDMRALMATRMAAFREQNGSSSMVVPPGISLDDSDAAPSSSRRKKRK